MGVRKSAATGMLVALVVQLCRVDASGAEVCHFTGASDYDGHVAVTTDVAAADSITRVDVAGTFEATTMFWLHIRYLIEEVSTWRNGELETVAVNSRYLVGDHIVRQQWDYFDRGADGLQAHRVQGKTFADFRRDHPGFAQHWDPATFGQAWLHDYHLASPKRRTDLDLKDLPPPSGLRSPLAMAFYWVRWLPRGNQDVPVFLPGFKSERLLHLKIEAASSSDGTVLRAPLRYSAFSETPVSIATARTSPDGHLLQLAFEVHGSRGSGRGLILQDGCDGTPMAPPKQRQ